MEAVFEVGRVERFGVEVAANPFKHLVMLLMLRVLNGFQEPSVAPRPTTVLGRTGAAPADAHGIASPRSC